MPFRLGHRSTLHHPKRSRKNPPMETAGIQAMWLGRELMFIMPKANQKGDPTLRSRAAVELNTMAYP
jgi:hypothetical protein